MKKSILVAVISVLLAVLFSMTCFAGIADNNSVTPRETVSTIVTDQTLYTIKVNDMVKINITHNSNHTGYTYVSNATVVATVDSAGNIVGRNPGTTSIRITANNGDFVEVYVKVLPIPVETITASVAKRTLYVGETVEIVNYFEPVNASNKAVTYVSSNDAVAYVDKNGLITATGSGVATIMISSAVDENVFTTIDIIVKPAPYFQITIPATMNIDETVEFEIVTRTELEYEITMVSSNPSVVTVNDDNTVTSGKEGKAKITSTIVLSDGYVVTLVNEVTVDDPDTEPRCVMCDIYEANIGTPGEIFLKIIHTIVHFFDTLLLGL